MKPAHICKDILGFDKLQAVLDELSSPQFKAILKEGGVKVKLPGGYVTQKKRRSLWQGRITAAIEEDNHELAGELLQQWLLNHRRPMLIDYLDRLEIKHRDGETDESFLISGSLDRIRDAAQWLAQQHDPTETRAYLTYIAYQQRSTAFDDWDGLQAGTAPPAAE